MYDSNVSNDDETQNTLIAYFSYTGNTEKVAQQIAEQTGGILVEIERATPYDDASEEGEEEIENNVHPEITVDLDSVDDYDTIFVCLLVISILDSMLSGIILSRHVFDFINIRGINALAGRIHMTCAYWGFVLMSLHLGIHWRMIVAVAGKQSSKSVKGQTWNIRTWILRILGASVELYGLYAFVKRNIASYLFLQVHFVFFDYSEPVIFYILDYAAAMGMMIFLGYYLNKRLQSIYRKVHTE